MCIDKKQFPEQILIWATLFIFTFVVSRAGEPEPGVFGSLEPEPLEKKNQEPEPESQVILIWNFTMCPLFAYFRWFLIKRGTNCEKFKSKETGDSCTDGRKPTKIFNFWVPSRFKLKNFCNFNKILNFSQIIIIIKKDYLNQTISRSHIFLF